MKILNDKETIDELLDISKQFIEIFEKYGLQPPAPAVERLIAITKTFREQIEDEQGIIESETEKT